MDIEGAEWDVLSSFVRSPEAIHLVRQRIRQIGFEIHTIAGAVRKQPYSTWMKSEGRLDAALVKYMQWILNNLESILGFRRWSFHFNHRCAYTDSSFHVRSFCYEIVYINERFIQPGDLSTDLAISQ